MTPEEIARLKEEEEKERQRRLADTGATDTTALATASLLAAVIGANALHCSAIISRRRRQ